MTLIDAAYRDFLASLGKTILGTRPATGKQAANNQSVPSMADGSNPLSVAAAEGLLSQLRDYNVQFTARAKTEQNQIGSSFGPAMVSFLSSTLNGPMQRIRPMAWEFQVGGKLTTTAQYRHLAVLQRLERSPDRLSVQPRVRAPGTQRTRSQEADEERAEALVALTGDYIVAPDLLVLRPALKDSDLNPAKGPAAFEVGSETGRLADLRREFGIDRNARRYPLCHANVSLKWTMRSDRAQNVRTEALQMIRQRRGPMPRMVAVTAEPLPSRLESLARGTGEIDAVYHIALHALIRALELTAESGHRSAKQAAKSLPILIALRDAGRLKDVRDLPFDLAS